MMYDLRFSQTAETLEQNQKVFENHLRLEPITLVLLEAFVPIDL